MMHQISVVICAAGAGKRMGCTKALCQLTPTQTFLTHIVETIHQVNIHHIVVVIGAQADEVRQNHAHLDVIWAENKDWKTTHMLESLTCGLQYVPDDHAVLHWPVDCIGITPQDLKNLVDAPDAPFAVLAHQGNPGHPLRIAPHKVQILKSPTFQAQNLRSFISQDTCIHVEAGPNVLMNCNDAQTLKNFMLRRD